MFVRRNYILSLLPSQTICRTKDLPPLSFPMLYSSHLMPVSTEMFYQSADVFSALRRVTHLSFLLTLVKQVHLPAPPTARPLVLNVCEGECVASHTHTHSPPYLFVDIIVIRQAPHLPQNGSLVLHWLCFFFPLCREHQHSHYHYVWCVCVCVSIVTDGFIL